MANIRSSWNKIARHYRGRYEISTNDIHYGPLCPGESGLKLLGNLKAKRVLDLGCGGGQNAVAMAKAGATVSAVDFSEHQIAHARELASREKIQADFHVGDIRDLGIFPKGKFDLVLSACAISFVKEIDLVFGEACRVLKSGGLFVLSDMHPLQYILDEIKGGIRFNHAYPFAPILMKWRWEFGPTSESGDAVDVPFQHYVRSLGHYANVLVDSGFTIEKIIEPEATQRSPHRGFSREIWYEYRYIAENLPITFIMLTRKRIRAKS